MGSSRQRVPGLAALAPCAGVLGIILSVQTSATVTIYHSESDFLNAAPVVSTETFGAIAPIFSPQAVIDQVVYEVDGPCFTQGEPNPCWFTELGELLSTFPQSNINEHRISFGAGNTVRAFGFSFGSFGGGRWEVIVHEIDGTHTIEPLQHAIGTSYLGFVSDVGIRALTVRDPPADGGINWKYDNVSRSEITAAEVSTYRLTRIGDQAFSPIISDINESGTMVGRTRGSGEPARAILLRDGVVTELGDLAGGAAAGAGATALNDLSQVTGTNDLQGDTGSLVTRGFFWEDGRIGDLGIEPESVALDINEQAQVVGFSASAEDLARPFVWQAGRTTFLEALVCLGNPGGVARAINDSGVIVGHSLSPAGRRAVMWRDGGRGGITILEPFFPLEHGEAFDVNDRGDAIGSYFNESGPQRHTAFLWQGDIVMALSPLAHPEANAANPESINNQGEIVGHTHLGSGQSIATLWRGTTALDLNALVDDEDPSRAFVKLAFGIKITDSGLIVASGTDSRDAEPRNNVYFLLRPTSAPASFAAVPPPSSTSPPPSASSPPARDNSGGGAVDLVSLLLLVVAMSASAARVRRWRRAVPG